MLTGLMYVLVPMPYLFFGSAGDSYGYGSLASGCGLQQQQPRLVLQHIPMQLLFLADCSQECTI